MSALGLLASGYAMIFFGFGGFSGIGLHIHIMQLLGIVMILLFAFLFHGPWLAFKRAIDQEDVAEAAARLSTIRMIVLVNLTLGRRP